MYANRKRVIIGSLPQGGSYLKIAVWTDHIAYISITKVYLKDPPDVDVWKQADRSQSRWLLTRMLEIWDKDKL